MSQVVTFSAEVHGIPNFYSIDMDFNKTIFEAPYFGNILTLNNKL